MNNFKNEPHFLTCISRVLLESIINAFWRWVVAIRCYSAFFKFIKVLKSYFEAGKFGMIATGTSFR